MSDRELREGYTTGKVIVWLLYVFPRTDCDVQNVHREK